MPVPPGLIKVATAAAGSGGGFLGSLFGNIGAKKRQKAANAWNLEQWHRENAYNNPAAQMQRLKDAGLNPNLIYGTSTSGATGNAGSVHPAKAPPFKIDIPDAMISLLKYANIKQAGATTDNLQEQHKVIAQDAILKGQQTTNLATQNSLDEVKLGVAPEMAKTSLEAAKEGVRLLEAKTIGNQIDNEVKDRGKADRLKEIKYQAENAKQTMKGTELANALKQLELELAKMGIYKHDPWVYRILGFQAKSVKPIRLFKKNK